MESLLLTLKEKLKPLLASGVFTWILSGFASFPLVVLAYIGTFTRYMADDYNKVVTIENVGFWGAQVFWYMGWTGRFTSIFIASFLAIFDVYAARWLPAIGLILWFAILLWALKYSLRLLRLPLGTGWLILLVSTIIFTTNTSFQDFTQVLLWQTGIVFYLVSTIAFTTAIFYFAMRFHAHPNQPVRALETFLVFLLFFLFAGMSDTLSILQIALLFCGLGIPVFIRDGLAARKNFLFLILVGFIAASIGFFIAFIAPGNAARKPDLFISLSPYSVFEALHLSGIDVAVFLSGWISEKTTLVAMLVVVSLLAGYVGVSGQIFSSGKQTRVLVYLFFVCFLALWMGFFPGWFIFRNRPPDWAIYTPLFAFVFGLTLVFAWVGNRLRQLSNPVFERMPKLALTVGAGLYILAITLTFLSPLRVGVSYVNLIPVFRHYAQLWDERDTYLRQAKIAGQTDVVVFSFKGNPDFRDIRKTIWVRGDMEDNPQYWINNEASAYYDLNSIIAVNETK